MPLKLNSTGGGSVTLDTPSTASNFTVTMPSNTQTLGIQSATAQASTSGTSIDFTGIPSWVKRVTVILNQVSTSGTSNLLIQLGTGSSPTYTTSGYTSSASSGPVVASTAGFIITYTIAATQLRQGLATIANITGNTWVQSSVIGDSTINVGVSVGSGAIALGAALTAVRVTTVNGTDTFDAGSINILYEG